MKNKKTTIIITAIVAIAVIITIIQLVVSSKGSVKEVNIVLAAKKDLTQAIRVTGNIQAKNSEQIMLNSAQKITEVLAIEGQQVKEGEIIAKIDPSDYLYQLKKAQTSYDVALSNLNMAKTNLNNLVNTKSISSKKNMENAVKQAQINFEGVQSNLNDAKTKLEQNEQLLSSGIISSLEYDSSVKSVTDLENQLKLSELQLENAQRNLSDFGVENKSQIEQQRSQVQQLTKQLESVKADIDNINSKINESEIKSTIDGKIIKLNLKKNQYPTQENNIITIYDLSQYKVTVSISQYDAVQLNVGQRAEIKVKGLDKSYEGTVSKIGEAAELTLTGTTQESKVKVEVTISNPDDKIKVGYEADVDIILMEEKDAVTVDIEAINKDKDGNTYIFVAQNSRAVKRIVKTGTETEFDIQILEGLKEKEAYVKNPPVSLKEGDLLKATGGK